MLCRAVAVERVWMRPAVEGKNAGVFMDIQTPACKDGDVLVGAQCADATRVELHGHTQDAQGVFRMRPVPCIPVMGCEVLKPGGLHVMLMGLKRTFREGEFVTLRLYFKQAGQRDVKVAVCQSMPQVQH